MELVATEKHLFCNGLASLRPRPALACGWCGSKVLGLPRTLWQGFARLRNLDCSLRCPGCPPQACWLFGRLHVSLRDCRCKSDQGNKALCYWQAKGRANAKGCVPRPLNKLDNISFNCLVLGSIFHSNLHEPRTRRELEHALRDITHLPAPTCCVCQVPVTSKRGFNWQCSSANVNSKRCKTTKGVECHGPQRWPPLVNRITTAARLRWEARTAWQA